MVLNIFHLGSNLSCNLLNKLHGSCTNWHFIHKQNLVWFDSQNFNIYTESQLKKPTYITLFSATSSKYPRNSLRSMPMKFQNINPMSVLSTLTNTLTMIKTFALDFDRIVCNECNILPSIGFLIYLISPNPPTLLGCKLHHQSIL